MSKYLDLKESVRKLDEFNKFCKEYIKEYKKNNHVEEAVSDFTGYRSDFDVPEQKDCQIKELI
jgi:hypothetical protein